MAAQPEGMEDFFDQRAMTYNTHMAEILDVPTFYQAVANPIAGTSAPVTILDLGCGTGIELAYLFARAPKALITGIDLAERMMALLQQQYAPYTDQLTLIQDSYLDRPFPQEAFNYVCAVQTLHHLLPEEKQALYARIYASLRPGGAFIEGDYTVSLDEEIERRSQYLDFRKDFPTGIYHVDIPCAVESEYALLCAAGFIPVDITYRAENCTVFVARKLP